MPAVQRKEREPFEVLWRRFRKLCDNAGIVQRCRSLEFFEKPTVVNRRKRELIAKRRSRKV